MKTPITASVLENLAQIRATVAKNCAGESCRIERPAFQRLRDRSDHGSNFMLADGFDSPGIEYILEEAAVLEGRHIMVPDEEDLLTFEFEGRREDAFLYLIRDRMPELRQILSAVRAGRDAHLRDYAAAYDVWSRDGGRSALYTITPEDLERLGE